MTPFQTWLVPPRVSRALPGRTTAGPDRHEWQDRFLADAQIDIWVSGIGVEGASVRIKQRVPTGTHGPVASELRLRLAAALVSASIATGRWDTPLPISSALAASQAE